MKNELDKLGKIKQAIHAVQAVFIFMAWALSLAVLTKDGQDGGQTGFYFGLVSMKVLSVDSADQNRPFSVCQR